MHNTALQGDVSSERLTMQSSLTGTTWPFKGMSASKKVNLAELSHMHDLALPGDVSSEKINQAELSHFHDLVLLGDVSSEKVTNTHFSHRHDLALKGESDVH